MKKYIDFLLFKILVLFYTFVSLISFFKIFYLKTNDIDYQYSTWKEIFFESILLDWIIVILLMSIIAITTKIMLIKKVKWGYIILFHLFLSVLIGFIIYLISSTVYLLAGQITISEINIKDYLASIISVIDLNFLVYFSMTFIVYTFYYFQKSQEIELEKSQLTNQLTNAKLNILRHKLHPHFLFNALNSISSLIESNSKLAQNTIADLGDLLRDLLMLKDTSLIPLKEELKISKKYLDIMSLRFSDDLSISITIDDNIDSVNVPSLLLLPILENSIKHGYSYENTSLKISLTITKIKENLNISIKNDGTPLKNKKNGNGLQNTIDRLKLLYKNNYTFSIKTLQNKKGVKTTIVIPIS